MQDDKSIALSIVNRQSSCLMFPRDHPQNFSRMYSMPQNLCEGTNSDFFCEMHR